MQRNHGSLALHAHAREIPDDVPKSIGNLQQRLAAIERLVVNVHEAWAGGLETVNADVKGVIPDISARRSCASPTLWGSPTAKRRLLRIHRKLLVQP
jgi:hypothetical protein